MRRSASASSLACLAVGLLMTGCPDRSIDAVNPLQGRVEAKDIPVNPNRDLDLLFLIDDSPSMSDKQNNLAKNFPRFTEVLRSIPGGLPNVHIGVATSDMGTKAEGDSIPGPAVGQIGQGGCSGTGKDGLLRNPDTVVGGDAFISDVFDLTAPGPDHRARNYTGNLDDVFGTMAMAGANGCAFEQHLAAAKRALSNQANKNFLRGPAYLAVIIIADEDDCSLQHTSLLASENSPAGMMLGAQQSFRCTRFGVTCEQGGKTSDAMNEVGPKGQCHPNDDSQYLAKIDDYVKFLKSLKPDDPSKIIVAGIMGTTEPFATEMRSPTKSAPPIPALAHSCTYVDVATKTEVADPPIRLKFFLDQFPNRSTFATICQNDLSGGLTQIGDLLKSVLGNPCIESKLADVDPKMAGPQYDCSVSSITNKDQPNQAETILPECTASNNGPSDPPCWHLIKDAAQCPRVDNLLLKVERQDAPQPIGLPQNAHVLANCVTQAI